MQSKDIFERLKKIFGESVMEYKEEAPSEPFIIINSKSIVDICLYLRDDKDLLFDYLSCLSGMDLGENLGVVYHLYSLKYKHKLVLKVIVPKNEPTVPTIERVWRSADWHEREAWDLMGIKFEGHRNLKRILCPEDWEGHPLRKDYVTPEFYHNMKVPY
jgi:NADH-quinone oxidoreductase subunit C